MRRYYQILGVPPTASQEEIRAAWKFSIKAFHPDKFASSSEHQRATAETRTRAINEAYATLSDPTRRAAYDRMYEDGVRTSTSTSATPAPVEAEPPQASPAPHAASHSSPPASKA